jgi:hypothetical protein
MSACMLIMDDNHWLIEWIAYHYLTVNLRHLILAIDQRSRTSPIQILDRWKDRIQFELWNDTHFFHHPPRRAHDLQVINEARQQAFLAKCLQTLKVRNYGWSMFTDTDEYVVINPRARGRRKHKLYRPNIPTLDQPGSIMTFLNREKRQYDTKCFSMGRLQFSPDEVDPADVQKDVPSYLNGSDFMTLRWLISADDLVGPKNIVDLSGIPAEMIPRKKTHQHRVLEPICGEAGRTWTRKNSLLQVYHYIGTYEQFTFRDDARLSTKKAKGRNVRYERYTGRDIGRQDDLRPWLKGFIDFVGKDEALRLLDGIGRTHGWEGAQAHVERFVDPKLVPIEWPPAGSAKGDDQKDSTDEDESADEDDDDAEADGDDEENANADKERDVPCFLLTCSSRPVGSSSCRHADGSCLRICQ